MRTTGWVAVLVITLAFAPASFASGVSVTDLTNGVTATQLAQSLASGGVAISNVTYTGADRAAGSFTGGTSSIGFGTGVVLSSGNVQTHELDDPCSRGVEGPNNCYEAQGADSGGPDGGENSTGLGTSGDSDLDTLSGGTTEDAAVLSFDFVPQQSTVHFSYVFSSEEYSDFANSDFNDVFGFFVNGTNCALVPNTSDPVAINTINNGNDTGGDTTAHNANLFRDNVRPSPSIDSQMDGLTTVLTCTASVNANQTNHLKLAIADTSDSAYDSAVFIQAGSLVSGNTLTVNKGGNGAGSVSSSPSGINCGATCSAQYANGTMVTLTATPAAGSTFTGWSGGGCSGTGTCEVTMNADTAVTATFTLVKHTLTVSKNGAGTVSSSPAGISCGATCTHDYDHGTVVTLTPTPDSGSVFTGWTGDCSGTGACMVTMDQARSVTATFAVAHTLTVSRTGNGSGSVSSSPSGITCGATCSAPFADGTMVTLTATPAAGSTFTGWSGGGCSGTGTCVVTLNADASVTATFALNQYTLTVTKAGAGSGSVSSSPAGIDCGATCSAQYTSGTSVTLTATAATGSTFAGWSGACSGTATCTVTMDQARSVTATFDTVPVESGPPSVPPGGLFCGVQHRGKCNGIKIKTEFSGPGNAVWQFAAYNPSPGHSRAHGAASKVVVLGTVKKTITKAGTVTIIFKLKPGAKTKKLYKKVVKLKLKAIRVTLTFTTASGQTVTTITSVKLKR